MKGCSRQPGSDSVQDWQSSVGQSLSWVGTAFKLRPPPLPVPVQIARVCGASSPHLYKVLRVLAQHDLLDELPRKRFNLNDATRELVQVGGCLEDLNMFNLLQCKPVGCGVWPLQTLIKD